MSFWSNFSVKAPAVLSGVAGLSGAASVVFPQYSGAFQGLATIFGLFGASLHANNPATPTPTASATVTSTVTESGQQPRATVELTQPVAPVPFPTIEIPVPQPTPQPQPAFVQQPIPQGLVTAEAVSLMIAQAIEAYKAAQANLPPQHPTVIQSTQV